MKKLIALFAALALGVGLAGCPEVSGDDESRDDAHDTANIDRDAPRVIAFNNHYPNVETKCDGHGHRIFVTTHDSAVGDNFVVIADPSCDGYVPETAASGISNGGN